MLKFPIRSSSSWLGIALFGAITLLATTHEVAAQAGKGKPPATSDPQLASTIQLLHSVHKTLEMANHDYGGHRAAALRDISAAVKELKQAHAKAGGKKDQPKGKQKNPMEAQALSDSQLAGSIPMLQQAVTQLQSSTNDYGGHRAMAVAKLQAAIQQLQTALNYSKAKNQPK